MKKNTGLIILGIVAVIVIILAVVFYKPGSKTGLAPTVTPQSNQGRSAERCQSI